MREFETRERPAPFRAVMTPARSSVGFTPTDPVQVTSIFDSRPVNGQDFIRAGGTNTLDVTTTIETGFFSITVPSGYVAVIRGIKFEFYPIYASATISSVITRFASNGRALLFCDDILTLQITEDFLPFYYVVDEGQTFSVTSVRTSLVTLADRKAIVGDFGDPQYTVTIAGNLLTKANLPRQFEPFRA